MSSTKEVHNIIHLNNVAKNISSLNFQFNITRKFKASVFCASAKKGYIIIICLSTKLKSPHRRRVQKSQFRRQSHVHDGENCARRPTRELFCMPRARFGPRATQKCRAQLAHGSGYRLCVCVGETTATANRSRTGCGARSAQSFVLIHMQASLPLHY